MTVTAPGAESLPAPVRAPAGGGRIRAAVAMLGPAFVASVAYVDPGNFATNIQSGARYGYLLPWVVLVANLMAMLVQYLSAKLETLRIGPSAPGSLRCLPPATNTRTAITLLMSRK
jgi:manganese transport protein